VAPNKFLAKIASGWKKPDGLTVIAPERVEPFLAKLPVEVLWGVGPVTAARLRALGLTMLTDVRRVDVETLRGAVGSWAEGLKRMAEGIDERPVQPHHERKSAGTENTYALDLKDPEEIRKEIAEMADHCAAFLLKRQLVARTVTIKVRYGDFTTITRSDSRKPATREPEELRSRAVMLLERTEARRRAVRLLGVSVHGLEAEGETVVELPAQLDLLEG
jgi:DNA polymerase-4